MSSITKNDDPEVSFTSNDISIRNEMARRHPGQHGDAKIGGIKSPAESSIGGRKNLMASLNELPIPETPEKSKEE